MPRSSVLLRYGLILLPAMAGLYAQPIASFSMYTLLVLLFLSIAVLSRHVKTSALKALFTLVEIAVSGWLCYQYGLLMTLISLSSVCMYFTLSASIWRYALLLIHAAVLNAAFWKQELLWLVMAHLLLMMMAVFMSSLVAAAGRKENAVKLYDELRSKHYQLEEARSRLQQFTQQVEHAAQAEERTRISRQLHDDIGHRLIRIKMMMEAALYTVPADQARGMELLGQIRDQLGDSMEEMRLAVKRVHPGKPLSGDYSIDRLLTQVQDETGIQTSIQVKGLPYPLYPSQQLVLYKNAREALSNAIRHGKATEIQVRLIYEEHEVVMAVSNNGAVEPGEGGGGLGISGMKERTSLIGGRLEVSRQTPFTVITRLPVYSKSEIM
ncbi:sensor histidine kinase [Paenibacillus sp. JSM ZJ436]|uniref:sensor histidine kinase n=1 Tax=Paenibacillus sp. JSM ZJ436 TaxID=3376190 RepID=UPI0037AE4C84